MNEKMFKEVFSVYETWGFNKAIEYLFEQIGKRRISGEDAQEIMDKILRIAIDDEKLETA